MKHRLMIATVVALSFMVATAASAQSVTRSQTGMRTTAVQDNFVRPNRSIYATYLPGQGGCIDDNGFCGVQPCGD
jgi:hypothetical protein